MEYISNAAEVVHALQGNLAAQIQWLKSCQILNYGSSADGAITRYPHQGWVTPYFSNFAAMALLEEPAAYPLVERYLNWYLRNLENNGTILDYHYDQNGQPGPPDLIQRMPTPEPFYPWPPLPPPLRTERLGPEKPFGP